MYLSVPYRSVFTGVSVADFFISNAHSCFAPSICLRFEMQAVFWLAVRAFTKLGIAIAANRPMMATTIMISTSVKPALRDVLFFILFNFCLPFFGGVNAATGGLCT